MGKIAISQVGSDNQVAAAQELLREFTTWAFTLTSDSHEVPTFAGLEDELASLPGIYSPPAGRLLLATVDDQPAGCVCLKSHDATTCELKRMYVRPEFRGLAIGWQLVQTLLAEARTSGYKRVVLDSHISMKKAHMLYHAAGFRRVATPNDFPERLKPLVLFMACDLAENG